MADLLPTEPHGASTAASAPVDFEVDPRHYRHWRVEFAGPVARLFMQVDPDGGLRPGYELKLNSYDLGVDIELADVVRRLRFEHPEVRAVVLTSGSDRVFCAGANIHMLGASSHGWKVNFCKFTNETRCEIEDATAHSHQVYLAACNGTTAGGGYELALACEQIVLQDDGNSAVSLPEVPLLGVLPGTGGLTRLVDKRKVRRDRADVFSTTAEGVRGKRAVEWGLVDAVVPRSRFDAEIAARAQSLADTAAAAASALQGERVGVALEPLAPEATLDGARTTRRYRHVTLEVDGDRRSAQLHVTGPTAADVALAERGGEALRQAGAAGVWALRAYRELDDALLHLRVNHPRVGVVLVRTAGDTATTLAHDAALLAAKDHWFVHEVLLHMGRVLRRMDNTSRSFFALAGEGCCFVGNLLEFALACDRVYALDGGEAVAFGMTALNHGALPMVHGLARTAVRLFGEPAKLDALAGKIGAMSAAEADEAGLVTALLDELDWDDDTRVAIEERLSLSPDALTGMEQNLRFPGPESADSKIYARLSAWQNWIFIRPNATGPAGALTLYGRPERPAFDWQRT
jgi:benzoyl-CoA-dihydrodiol lyase